MLRFPIVIICSNRIPPENTIFCKTVTSFYTRIWCKFLITSMNSKMSGQIGADEWRMQSIFFTTQSLLIPWHHRSGGVSLPSRTSHASQMWWSFLTAQGITCITDVIVYLPPRTSQTWWSFLTAQGITERVCSGDLSEVASEMLGPLLEVLQFKCLVRLIELVGL